MELKIFGLVQGLSSTMNSTCQAIVCMPSGGTPYFPIWAGGSSQGISADPQISNHSFDVEMLAIVTQFGLPLL